MKHVWVGGLICAFCAGARAESSVVLYGAVDSGIEYMTGIPNANGKGSTSRWSAESGNWSTSLWGLKGTEDLGGGIAVVFQLESGFNANVGQTWTPGSAFDRWADVGVKSDAYGTLLLGRQLQIANDVYDFDPFFLAQWSVASLARGRNWNSSSNNISYQSPKFYGFDIHTQMSLSNATNWNGNGSTSQGRGLGIALTYSSSLFQIRGMYDETRDPLSGAVDDVFNFSREYTAMANLFLGAFKLSSGYQSSHSQAPVLANNGVTSTAQEWAGVTWQATAAASLIGAVYHVNANGQGGNATMYVLGGGYNLSKRTTLGFQVATIRNSKSAAFGLDPQPLDGPTNPFAGHSQTGAYVGIDHNF